MFKKLKEIQVLKSTSIKEAVVIMDYVGYGLCMCIDNSKKVIGIMTDGDFRRGVLNGIDLNSPVESIVNKNFIKIEEGFSQEDIEDIFLNTVARIVPVLGVNGALQNIIFKDVFFGGKGEGQIKENLPYPVVIMAGGEGTRLAPFTNILPKPLLPLGNDPVIKVIMDRLNAGGVDEFYITVNSKKQMIKGYFHDHKLPYKIHFVDDQGLLVSMHEKPEQDLLVNTGLYFLNRSVLDLISGDKFLHMTDIIHILKEKGFRVGLYPVTEKSWLDVGQWEGYSETLKQLGWSMGRVF